MSAIRLSYPGQPIRLVPDPDPFAGLTARQRRILEVVRSCNGNRSRAARHLGITVQAVQDRLRSCRHAGATVPPIARRGRDLRARRRAA